MSKPKPEPEVGTLPHYKVTLDALEAARAKVIAALCIDEDGEQLIDDLLDAAHAEALSGMSCDFMQDDKPAQAERVRRELAQHAAAVAKIKTA